MISIWFFIGISLAVNGALICAAGIYQVINPPANPDIVLFNLHANVWWGAVLLIIGNGRLRQSLLKAGYGNEKDDDGLDRGQSGFFP